MSLDIGRVVSAARQTRSLIDLARGMPRDPVSAMSSALSGAGLPDWASALRSGRVDAFRNALGPTPVAPRPDLPAPTAAPAAATPTAGANASSGDPPPSGSVLLSLGPVQFLAGALAHQSIARSVDYRWAAQDRLGRTPAHQFLGRGEETIELSGYTLTHYTGGAETITRLRALADQGEPQALVDASGTVLGLYVLTRVETTGSELDASGRPLMLEFRLAL
ncbi:MAG: phage tail protein, partial [Xanthomonadaceae bacterium]|nr:phage tail protein [Xanthomonadaceae bacterium]